jgi:hypothetical protein
VNEPNTDGWTVVHRQKHVGKIETSSF